MSNKNKIITKNKEISIEQNSNKNQNEKIKNLKENLNKKEIDLKENLDKEETELIEKQRKEIDELIENFDIKIRPKLSSYYLDLKKREYFLCKQDRFIEAEETKQKAKKIYFEDNKHIEDEKKLKLFQKLEELENKNRIEYMKFAKNKDRQIYYLMKEEDEKKKIEIDKFKKEKDNNNLQKNIKFFIEKNKKKLKKDKTDNITYKRNKNNPWS